MADTSHWGFTRADLEKYKVEMIIDVSFKWSEETPEALRQTFGQAAAVLQLVAGAAIDRQLKADGLTPTSLEGYTVGVNVDGKVMEIKHDA